MKWRLQHTVSGVKLSESWLAAPVRGKGNCGEKQHVCKNQKLPRWQKCLWLIQINTMLNLHLNNIVKYSSLNKPQGEATVWDMTSVCITWPAWTTMYSCSCSKSTHAVWRISWIRKGQERVGRALTFIGRIKEGGWGWGETLADDWVSLFQVRSRGRALVYRGG